MRVQLHASIVHPLTSVDNCAGEPASYGADYVDYCWHIEVITRNGYDYLAVEANEKQGGTIVGDLIDAHDNVPAKTPALFELVGTSDANAVASAPTITCYYPGRGSPSRRDEFKPWARNLRQFCASNHPYTAVFSAPLAD